LTGGGGGGGKGGGGERRVVESSVRSRLLRDHVEGLLMLGLEEKELVLKGEGGCETLEGREEIEETNGQRARKVRNKLFKD